jgi:hypothetical protein
MDSIMELYKDLRTKQILTYEPYEETKSNNVAIYEKNDNGDYIEVESWGHDPKYVPKGDIDNRHATRRTDGSMLEKGYSSPYPPIQYYSFKEKITKSVTTKKERRVLTENIDTTIAGTAFFFFTALWRFVLTNPKIWSWMFGLIHDHYWMVFTSPFVWSYWIITTCLYVPTFIILSLLIVLSIPYTLIVEIPAGLMNNEEIHVFSWMDD